MWNFIVQIATQLSWLFNYLLLCSFAIHYYEPYYEYESPAEATETTLSTVHYKSPNTAESFEEECAVCLTKIEEGEEIRELRCAHLFHKACLDRWTGSALFRRMKIVIRSGCAKQESRDGNRDAILDINTNQVYATLHCTFELVREDVKRTSALRLKVRTSSVLRRLTLATTSLVPGRQHRLQGRFLSFQDWLATSFPAGLKLWMENTMIDQGWPENLSPANPGRREAVLEACAVVREGEKPSSA
ncbi:hypothetical protein ACLB2K_000023 [Fragaria x ananassa]